MTLQEILNAHKGYTERQINDWRRTRWLGAVFANAFSSKEVKPSDLMTLPGDGEAKDNLYADDIKYLKERRHGK
jgi:hypothetical protein